MKKICRYILIFIEKIKQLFSKNIFEGKNRVAVSAKVKNSKVGLGSYITKNSEIYNTTIGRFCSLGPRLKTVIGTHPINFISTHPAFYSTNLQAGFSFVKKNYYNEWLEEIIIENDVWIGCDVIIFGGSKIRNGAIVAAGSLVKGEIPAYEIWGGIPAKKIRDRFDNETKEKLDKLAWWNKDIEWLKKNVDKLRDLKNIDII